MFLSQQLINASQRAHDRRIVRNTVKDMSPIATRANESRVTKFRQMLRERWLPDIEVDPDFFYRALITCQQVVKNEQALVVCE